MKKAPPFSLKAVFAAAALGLVAPASFAAKPDMIVQQVMNPHYTRAQESRTQLLFSTKWIDRSETAWPKVPLLPKNADVELYTHPEYASSDPDDFFYSLQFRMKF